MPASFAFRVTHQAGAARLGEFVTPQIVGGASDGSNFLFGNAVNARFTQALDWQSGSVMALFLLVVVAVLMTIFGRRIQVRTMET
jgi:ABC-type spermidine/putrescine transport system permease subunit I